MLANQGKMSKITLAVLPLPYIPRVPGARYVASFSFSNEVSTSSLGFSMVSALRRSSSQYSSFSTGMHSNSRFTIPAMAVCFGIGLLV
jgi:hypothetical protein